ncbi:Pentatricopeptide repeat-containing protein [Platanthera guangdongensis]|uniref:Pentatricopeptide repeat-containing protein n=1 Tax=Platanthera guangdongensis TaxID=2320717 RepID=A0ABR2LN45_9ASPA
MGTYYTLLNALAEDGRLEEAEEFWTKIFSQYLESLPRIFFIKIISLYYSKGLHEKIVSIFCACKLYIVDSACVIFCLQTALGPITRLLSPADSLVFADMEELGVKPDRSIVRMVGEVFLTLGMHDKYKKLHMKYPPPKWEYRHIKGKRVKILVKNLTDLDDNEEGSEKEKRFSDKKTETSAVGAMLFPSLDDEEAGTRTDLIIKPSIVLTDDETII